MGTLLQDLQYALRLFYKKPGFTVIAVLTLAVGIGANTAVFSVVNAFLLNPLPYSEPGRLVMIQHGSGPAEYNSVDSYPVFNDLREQSQSFDGVTAVAWRRLTLDSPDGPEEVFGSRVTGDFFSVLGVAPMLGRAFMPGEDEPNKPRTIILSHGLWQRRFGADPKIIGQTLVADKESLEVVGVMPPDFKFDLLPEIPRVEFFTPLRPTPSMVTARNVNWLRIIARLKPETTIAEARSELEVIAGRIRQNTPRLPGVAGNAMDSFALSAMPLGNFFVGDAQKPLLILLGAVGFVLLIACANVANLLLAHGVGRQKEIAIRSVLGASRRRLVSQMLTESLTLSVAGGLLGLLLVTWSLDAIVWLTPKWMSRMEEIRLDWRVFLFTLAVSTFTGVLFGLLPSMQASKVNLQTTLKLGTSTAGGTRRSLRGILVITEVALAVVLLVGAGLMITSFIRLTSVNAGFDPENVLSMRLNMLSRPTETEQAAFAREALQRVKGLPAVEVAAIIDSLPTEGGSSQSNARGKFLEGPIENPDAELQIEPRFATPEYFQTLGISLVKGRLFTEADTADTQPVVVVSEHFAREAWPGADPIGRRLLWNWAKDQRPTVIGVVSDVRKYNKEPTSMLYAPFGQSPSTMGYLAVRTSTAPLGLTAAVRKEIFAVDPRVVINDVTTLKQRLGDSVAQPRFYAVLLGLFGAIGILLAVIGLYGVISYSVNQQIHEIGIRMALGAQGRDILKLVVGHGLVLTIAGLAAGIAGAFALSGLLTGLLFEVKATDPVIYIAVSLLLLATALLACYIPARRATRVDPVVALRYE